MKISEISIKRPVTTLMIIFIVLILGFVSLSRLNIDLLPDINIPIAIVSTNYKGTGPGEVENIITKNLESALASVSNMKSIRSISTEGNSLIIVEFTQGTDMDFATLEIREKIDLVKKFLPNEASTPMVLKLNPNMMPIMTFGISSENKNASELNIWAEDILKPHIERIEGVASVNISGGSENEVKIMVNPEKLALNGLSMNSLANSLRMENINAPGGIITEGDYNLIVRTVGEFKNIDEIKNLPIVSQKGIFKLKDIADIVEDIKDEQIYSKINGENSLTISIQKESTANTAKTAAKINKEIIEIDNSNENINIVTILDQSEFINDSIATVSKSALVGGILAVIILLLFLKDIRPTLVIGVSIPISIIATFILIYFADITLNMISLGGLALGIGMLVDNSIVVLENIYRLKKEGLSNIEAAKQGSSEVTTAITASTLTTVSVFIPIIFVEGVTAEIFKQLALTVSFSLLASLFISLTLVPLISSKILSNKKTTKKNKTIEGLKNIYSKTLNWSLNHRIIVIFTIVAVFAASIISIKTIGTEFFPITDQGEISISVNLPKGMKYDKTVEAVNEVEEILFNIPEIDIVSSTIGSSRGFDFTNSGNNIGNLTVILKDKAGRSKSDIEIADEIRQLTSSIEKYDVNVNTLGNMMGSNMSSGSPIEVEISGDNFDILNKISNDVIDIVKNIKGTREVHSNYEKGAPELKIILDRNKSSIYGLNTAIVSNDIQTQLRGVTATRYKIGRKEIDITILNKNAAKTASKEDIKNMIISSPLGISVPLGSIADIEYTKGPVNINRKDQIRYLTVSSAVLNRSVGKVANDIEQQLKNYELPDGYSINITGENKQMMEAFSSLALALVLGVILVYMVMASQFESLINPFIIIFTVPLAFTGAFIGLFITNIPLNVPSYIGMIVLTGIIVNNGIVLIDYIKRLRDSGMKRNEAIMKAAPIRLQPILMTTLTTVLALLPAALGIGEGAELEQPLAVTVVGGLLFATILTLIVVPVLYTLFDDLSRKIKI